MRVIAIGDPHGNLKEIKKIPLKNVDLILLTGDLGSAQLMRKMSFENIERTRQGLTEKEYSPTQEKKAFMEAYTSTMQIVRYLARFAPVLTIFGNVESSNSETKKYSKRMGLPLPYLYNSINSVKGVRVVNNTTVNFKGLRIGGLPYFTETCWVKEFKPSEYKKNMLKAKVQTDKIRKVLKRFRNIDILVCHQPPYGHLDKVTAEFAPKSWQGKHAGSQVILHYAKASQPKYIFCGHIHESKGTEKIGKTEVYNLGVCGYQIIEL